MCVSHLVIGAFNRRGGAYRWDTSQPKLYQIKLNQLSLQLTKTNNQTQPKQILIIIPTKTKARDKVINQNKDKASVWCGVQAVPNNAWLHTDLTFWEWERYIPVADSSGNTPQPQVYGTAVPVLASSGPLNGSPKPSSRRGRRGTSRPRYNTEAEIVLPKPAI